MACLIARKNDADGSYTTIYCNTHEHPGPNGTTLTAGDLLRTFYEDAGKVDQLLHHDITQVPDQPSEDFRYGRWFARVHRDDNEHGLRALEILFRAAEVQDCRFIYVWQRDSRGNRCWATYQRGWHRTD